MAEPPVTFAAMLRRLRRAAGLTQEELAEAAGVSLRSISDLERGKVTIPQKDTVRLLADALHLIGPVRAGFEAVARGRAAPGGVAAATRTLPRDIASFTGRQRELQELVNAAAGAGSSRGVVSIHAIGGMAGVGKTAFAVHAAHQLADRFPAGQIFLALHGHTPGQQPVDPEDALASLLLTAGVSAGQIPPGLEARMALWRDRLASKQLLLVLDDAASSEQVQPLLPGAGGSLVLVTSRRHLSALDDATSVSLDTLPPDQAAALLVRLAGRAGLHPADPGVRQIVRLCGFLPLAIGLVARQLHHHPAWRAAGRAAELAAAVDRLELIATESLSVAVAFDLSYADLNADRQRLFRRLGLHPGADIDGYAAAALDGTGLAAARRGLEALYDQYLLAEPAQGRYRLHDLIREHARALAGRLDPDDDRDGAIGRLLDYYQHTSAQADALIARQPRTGPVAEAEMPAAAPALTDQEQALDWARTERANLLACLDHASGADQYDRIVALTAGVDALLRHDGPWSEALGRHAAALRASQYLGDRLGQANALNSLGSLRLLAGDNTGAARDLKEALGIYRDIGNRLGQANALHHMGDVCSATGDFAGAASDLREAQAIYRDLGNRLGQANALHHLSKAQMQTANYQDAIRAMEEAQAIYRDLGDRRGQANALAYLAHLRERTGDLSGADRPLDEAQAIYRDLGNRNGQANVLMLLGSVRRRGEDHRGAAQALEEALDIYRDLGNRGGEANALNWLGAVRRETGDLAGAARILEEALDIYREFGDRGGETEALNEAGRVYQLRGDLQRAASSHLQALDLAHQIGSAWDEAQALAGLGRCALAAGRNAEAEDDLRQALEIFQRLGSTEVDEVSRELAALTEAGPAA